MALRKPRNAAAETRNTACLAGLLLAIVSMGYPTPLPAQKSRDLREDFVGSSAGDFTLPDIEGKQVSLRDFKGKTVVLSFWASWCLPCKAELPTIQKVYEQNRDKNMVVLTVGDESAATISNFLKQKHYDFTVLIDSRRTLFHRFLVRYIPTVLVINGNGIIVSRIVGWRGPQELLAAVEAVERSNTEGPDTARKLKDRRHE